MDNFLPWNPTLKKIEIVIKDDNFEKQVSFFQQQLDDSLAKFQQTLKVNEEEYSKFLEKHRTLVDLPSEKISIKSPLTIFNAPWGSGKTYFLEKYIINFYLNPEKKNTIKDIIYIDVSKHVLDNQIQDGLVSEIIKKLILKNKNITKKAYMALKNFGIDLASGIYKTKISIEPLGIGISTSPEDFNLSHTKETINLLNAKNSKKMDELSKKLPDKIENTLIIFDNLEKIQPYSWDILRVIIKLQDIENLCFLLPLNLETFKNNKTINDSAYPIERYININYFEMKQDYGSLLKSTIGKNKHFDQHDLDFFQKVLEQEIKGSVLSWQQADNLIKEYLKSSNWEKQIKESKHKMFFQKVWDPNL